MAQEMASRMARADHAAETAVAGQLPPCRNLDPLSPPLTPREYAMMERDRGKYLLYFAAIDQYVRDNKSPSRHRGRDGPLTAVIVGPGRGRLPSFLVDSCREHGVPLRLLALEANAECVAELGARWAEVDLVHAVLHPDWTDSDALEAGVPPRYLHGCHLSINELLGSFGCNEFMPELGVAIKRLFLRTDGATSIPRSWTTWVAPVRSTKMERLLLNTGKPLEATYVAGFDPDSATLLAEPAPILEGVLGEDAPVEGSAIFPEPSGAGALGAPTALCGWFTSTLYRDIQIDSRVTCSTFNGFHWESFLLPLGKDGDGRDGWCGGTAAVRRRVEQSGGRLSLWYEWSFEKIGARWRNAGGNFDRVHLDRPPPS